MSALKKLHEVDKDTKLVVSGYIRLKHTSLFKSNQYVLFQNIPLSISSLCTLYCYAHEYFEKVHEDMTLSSDKRTINRVTQSYAWDNYNFGKIIINSKSQSVCKWYLKLTGGVENYRNKLMIGIATNGNCDTTKPTWGLKFDHYLYWFDASIAKLRSMESTNNEYNVCLELNMKKRNIVFHFGDQDQEIVSSNIEIGCDIEYRMVVCLPSNDMTVTIMKFTQQYR